MHSRCNRRRRMACRAGRALVDIAPVTAGRTVGRDRVVFADFIPNNWSAWPNTLPARRHPGTGARSRVRIRAVRDWARSTNDHCSTPCAKTRSCSPRSADHHDPSEGEVALDGPAVGTEPSGRAAAFSSAVPGLAGVTEGTAPDRGCARQPREPAYDARLERHAARALHGSRGLMGSRDMFLLHTLKPQRKRIVQRLGSRSVRAAILRRWWRAEIRNRSSFRAGYLCVHGSVRTRAARRWRSQWWSWRRVGQTVRVGSRAATVPL